MQSQSQALHIFAGWLSWLGLPGVRLGGPPVTQAQPDCQCASDSAAGTGAAAAAYCHGYSKVLCQTKGKRFHAVQTILHGLGSRDGTRVRSKQYVLQRPQQESKDISYTAKQHRTSYGYIEGFNRYRIIPIYKSYNTDTAKLIVCDTIEKYRHRIRCRTVRLARNGVKPYGIAGI